MRIGCADCGCVVEAAHRVVECGASDCCCGHVPIAATRDRGTINALAASVKAALESENPADLAELLDPHVRWGVPDDPNPTCQSRSQVLSWYQHGREAGTRARLIGVATGQDTILLELMVSNALDPTTEQPRWQVLTCRNGRVVDIRGFDDRADAVARM